MQKKVYRAGSLQFKYVSFEPRRFIEALEKSTVGKLDLIARTVTSMIGRWRWRRERENVRHRIGSIFTRQSILGGLVAQLSNIDIHPKNKHYVVLKCTAVLETCTMYVGRTVLRGSMWVSTGVA